jgi:hypothetical protein
MDDARQPRQHCAWKRISSQTLEGEAFLGAGYERLFPQPAKMYFSECDVAADEELAEKAQALADLASALEIHGRIAARDLAATADSICAIYQRAIDIARPCGMRPLIAQCLAGMAQAHEAAGDIVLPPNTTFTPGSSSMNLGCRRIRQCAGRSRTGHTRGPSRLAADIDPFMAAFNAPRAPMKRGCLSDQATLLQEPHTVSGYCNALWRFTCAYQPATYLRVIDCRIDAIRCVVQV